MDSSEAVTTIRAAPRTELLKVHDKLLFPFSTSLEVRYCFSMLICLSNSLYLSAGRNSVNRFVSIELPRMEAQEEVA